MTTALQMISTALRRVGELAAGETLDPDAADDALGTLNAMMDSWSAQRLSVYQILQEALAVTGGTAGYTIGTSGTWNTARPVKLDNSSFIRISSIDYPLELISADAYAAQAVKGNESQIPYAIACNYAYPLATIYLYPTPAESCTIYLRSWKALQTFSDLETDLSLPPGYQRAIEWNLTKEYCPEYGKTVTADIMREAVASKSAIMTVNAPDMRMINEVAYNRFRDGGMNIYSG